MPQKWIGSSKYVMVTMKMVTLIQIFHTVLIIQLSVMRWSAEVSSLLPYGYHGQSSSHQDWWQMPLPTKQYLQTLAPQF